MSYSIFGITLGIVMLIDMVVSCFLADSVAKRAVALIFAVPTALLVILLLYNM